MVAVKSAMRRAAGLASVNEATGPLNSGGENTGTGKIDGFGRADGRLGCRGCQRRVGDDGRAAEDGDRAAVVGDRDGVGVGAFFGVGVGGSDGVDHAVGRADGGEVGGGKVCGSRAVAPVDDHGEPPPAVKSATVDALVGVGEGPEQDGGRSRFPRCR